MSWVDRVAAASARLVGTRGVVLCLHGLDADSEPSSPSMHISLTQFEGIVAAFRRLGRIVPLQDVMVRYLEGRSTAGLIALTADDAYASWLMAEPFLTREAIPLTIFAVGDALQSGPSFWWDRIDDSVSMASPERWRSFEDACGLPEVYRRGQAVNEGPGRPLRQWILAEHSGRWPLALEQPLARLEEDLRHRTVHRAMTGSELSGFLERTAVQVGVHTLSHAALPFLSDAEVIAEVRQGHEMLRERFPGALPYLAIPFGLFEARTLRLAADAGMTVSLTLSGDPLDRAYALDIGVPRLCIVREHTPGLLTLKVSRVAALVNRMRGRSTTSYPILPSPTS